MFGNVARDEGPQLLVYFIVLVMLVHPPDVVQHVFVDHRPQLFVLETHLPQQELYCTHRQQDVLGPQDH